jgi:hypothetical protein
MPYPVFDRSKLVLRPLGERIHDLEISTLWDPGDPAPEFDNADLPAIAHRMAATQGHRRSMDGAEGAVILMMGAHLIRAGASRLIIDLMRRGVIHHIGMNGACVIHDFELALVGATTESVARYIRTGEFGLWEETGQINDLVNTGYAEGLGFGETVGRFLAGSDFPNRQDSILGVAYELGVPVTVHVGIGYDIIHEHPNFDGAATGGASYRDFLTLAHSVDQLEGGVLLNFGSAVMGPETYLKALSMVRNVAKREERQVAHFTTAVFDLTPLPETYRDQPPKSNPFYYYRPWKTILVRTVADGGESYFVRGDHRVTFPNLHHLVVGQL